MIYIVEFFIELLDENKGTEDVKNIVEYIKNLKNKNIIEKLKDEFIPNELYQLFFKECIEIDENPKPTSKLLKKNTYKYKCTQLRLQQKLEEWLIENNYKIQVKNNHNNYLLNYKNDIKRYIKLKYNKEIQTINLIDKKTI